MIGQLAQILWQLAALAFLALVVFTVRRARARGKRLFRDLPNERINQLAKPPVYDHSQDAI